MTTAQIILDQINTMGKNLILLFTQFSDNRFDVVQVSKDRWLISPPRKASR